MRNRKVPNPWGKKGGPKHQECINSEAKEIEAKGMDFVRELKIDTPSGEKKARFADIVSVDKESGNIVDYIQVGKATRNGEPVARERRAMNDIEKATGIKPVFRPYNLLIFALVTLASAYLLYQL